MIPDAHVLITPPDGRVVNSSNVNYSWNASSGATQYHIQVAFDSVFTMLGLDANIGGATALPVSGFPNDGTTFYWRVKAGNSAGWGPYADPFMFVNGIVPMPPDADFTVDTTGGCSGTVVTFSDASSNTPTSWNWNFPGGSPSTSTDPNPVVTYDSPGNYDVTLVVSNNDGIDAEAKANFITIYPNPNVNAGNDLSLIHI